MTLTNTLFLCTFLCSTHEKRQWSEQIRSRRTGEEDNDFHDTRDTPDRSFTGTNAEIETRPWANSVQSSK